MHNNCVKFYTFVDDKTDKQLKNEIVWRISFIHYTQRVRSN